MGNILEKLLALWNIYDEISNDIGTIKTIQDNNELLKDKDENEDDNDDETNEK